MKDKYFIPQSRASELVGQSKGEGGGGNPNSMEIITGTLAEPFGEHSIAELVSAISKDNATVKMAISMGQMSGVIPILANVQFTQLYSSACDVVPSGGSATVQTAVFVSYLADEGLKNADVIAEGQYMDLVSQADQIATEITIIWHPLSR